MNDFFAITFLITLAAISPGPDFALVVKNSAIYNRDGGIATAIGISFSLLFHATYCILGLDIIIAKSAFLFNIIKYLGASYLIYIGMKSLFAKNIATHDLPTNSIVSSEKMRAFKQGFLCNILNPKAILFLVGLFTMVVKPDTSLFILIAYAIESALIPLIWFVSLSLFLTHPKTLSYVKKGQTMVTRIMGGFLIIFGVRIATLVLT